MPKIFHPLLALIASATNNELAKYVKYLKQENKTTVFAVKWRNMKVHFATAESTHATVQKYTFPLVVKDAG